MSKKKPRYLTDRHYYGHPSNHMPYLVICTAALLIAAAVGALLLSMAWDYTTARYQLEVDAVLVDIREGTTEKWDYIEGKDEARTPAERATRTYTESVYSFDWEYEINGEKLIWTTSESSYTAHKLGDTMQMRLWSNDGTEYHRSYHGSTTILLTAVCAAVFAAALYIIVRIIIIKILIAKRKNKGRR